MNEIWKAIPEFDGYEVSSEGRIRSYFKRAGGEFAVGPRWEIADEPQRILSPGKSGKYLYVNLRRDGESHNRRVAHLVLEAFLGPRPEGLEICHNNGNATDNRLANLRYDTAESNTKDMIKHGQAPNTDLCPKDIIMIRQRAAAGISRRMLQREYGASKAQIARICRGATFTCLGGPLTPLDRKLSEHQVIEIRERAKKGRWGIQRQLAEEFNVDPATISLIVNNKRHKK